MAFKTTTWNNVIGLTEARVGLEFEAPELGRVGFLLNSAAKYIYDENRYWPRFLVLEPRTVLRGYIATTEDSYNVYGAGTEAVNGLYKKDNFTVSYTHTSGDYKISNDGSNWYISDTATSSSQYFNGGDPSGPPPNGVWSTTLSTVGVSPGPYVQALSEIDEYIGHWDGAKWQGGDPSRMAAYPDQNGIRVTYPQEGTVYVAFKKTLVDTYGDGTGGSVAAIPSEWAEYMAYSAARSYRASQAQPDGFNPIAIRDVDNVLNQALIKVGKQGVYDTLANQFKTRFGMDISIR
jgi:hypothetical protein